MRRIRLFSIILFVLALLVFGVDRLLLALHSDSEGPVIEMKKETVMVSVSDGEDAILAGVTAVDEVSGDVTDSLLVETLSDFISPGRRQATLAAFDENHNITRAVREVAYSDYKSPRFALSQPLRFALGTTDLTSNLAVEDVLDGSLTRYIKLAAAPGASAIDVGTPGEYSVVFSVTNSAGDTAKLPATVTIYNASEERVRPQISLSQCLVYIPRKQAFDPWSYVERITVSGAAYKPAEREDGTPYLIPVSGAENPSVSVRRIEIEDGVNTRSAGTYEVLYKITAEVNGTTQVGTVRLIAVVE